MRPLRLLLPLLLCAVSAWASPFRIFDADEGFVQLPEYFALFRQRLSAARRSERDDLRWLFEQRLRYLVVQIASLENQLGYPAAGDLRSAPGARVRLRPEQERKLPELLEEGRRVLGVGLEDEWPALDEDREPNANGRELAQTAHTTAGLRTNPIAVPYAGPIPTAESPAGWTKFLENVRGELSKLAFSDRDPRWKALADAIDRWMDTARFQDPELAAALKRLEDTIRLRIALLEEIQDDQELLDWVFGRMLEQDEKARRELDPVAFEKELEALQRAQALARNEGILGRARVERQTLILVARRVGVTVPVSTDRKPDLATCHADSARLARALAHHYPELDEDVRKLWEAVVHARLGVWGRWRARADARRAGAPAWVPVEQPGTQAMVGTFRLGAAALAHARASGSRRSFTEPSPRP